MTIVFQARTRPVGLFFPPPTLQGRYHIHGPLGHGGCGRVFRAWDRERQQEVALKRAYPEAVPARLLQREAEILQSVQHPRIPAFLNAFEEEGRFYLVEEWRQGFPLKRKRHLSLSQVRCIGLQCCEVLSYLHQRAVFHGDCSPGNVLWTGDAITLVDFGMACRRGERLEEARGTPGYVSPEQWDQGVVSEASDVYCLAMLLGCLLTDCHPHEVRRAGGAFTLLWDAPWDIPARIRPLLIVLDRAIAPDPRKRPALAELQQALSQVPLALRTSLFSCVH